jgi:ATP-dependent helicase HrpB
VLALPIDDFIPEIRRALDASRAVVVTAQPGAGKTTRVPPALAEIGSVILLQPRRVAARAIAQWIAEDRGWTVGREVGWQVRFERRFGADTRLLVATEGVLTGRFQQDPLLSGFRTIVIDEFHERSIHADLALALARQAWRARSDLRLVVMSATLDAAPIAAFLGGCPIVEVPGRTFPIEVDYAAGEPAAAAAETLLRETGGDILCFEPGAFEIRRTIAELQRRVGPRGVDVLPLYGGLDAVDQDRAVRGGAASRRRIIVATNIAETSLTVPGVTGVVDTGLQKVARYDASRAIDSLTIERITQDSADQRGGRAGRLAPGRVRRLWDARDRLRPHREPEIQRVDLSAAVLDVIAWGGRPSEFEWFEPPRGDALDAAIRLLERLGAIRGGRLTDVGRRLTAIPFHPRLARMLLAARGATAMARACALLADRHTIRLGGATTSSDLLSAIDHWDEAPPHIRRTAMEIQRIWKPDLKVGPAVDDVQFRRAVLGRLPGPCRAAPRAAVGAAEARLRDGCGSQQRQRGSRPRISRRR